MNSFPDWESEKIRDITRLCRKHDKDLGLLINSLFDLCLESYNEGVKDSTSTINAAISKNLHS